MSVGGGYDRDRDRDKDRDRDRDETGTETETETRIETAFVCLCRSLIQETDACAENICFPKKALKTLLHSDEFFSSKEDKDLLLGPAAVGATELLQV